MNFNASFSHNWFNHLSNRFHTTNRKTSSHPRNLLLRRNFTSQSSNISLNCCFFRSDQKDVENTKHTKDEGEYASTKRNEEVSNALTCTEGNFSQIHPVGHNNRTSKVSTSETNVQQKEQKILVISLTDTITNPRTMMI